MISEEEKEAIDYFTKDKDYFNEQIKIIEMMDTDYYDEELNLYKKRAKHYQIILNLISKLQKELDKIKKVEEENE